MNHDEMNQITILENNFFQANPPMNTKRWVGRVYDEKDSMT